MKQFLSSKSKLLCVSVLCLFVAIAALIAFFDSEPVIAFTAVMLLSLVVLLPLCGVMFFQIHRAKSLLRQQEELYGVLIHDAPVKQINSHIAISDEWIANCALSHQCLLHRYAIVSIHECEKGLEIMTEFTEKPFYFRLSDGEEKETEKQCILHWYDPLYEIPLHKEESYEIRVNNKRKTAALTAVLISAAAAVCVIFAGLGASDVLDSGIEDDKYIYFYEDLTKKSTGSLEQISYDIIKVQDEYLMTIYNDGDLFTELEIDCYDETDTLSDTVWTGIIRPHHYTSIYLDHNPATVKFVSSEFYDFDYHVPSFDYAVEYAQKEYYIWVNAVLDSELVTLENVIDLGIREYAIEELAYTGADCVYVYDEETAVRSTQKSTGVQMLETTSALYRIDFELFDYRIQIYELNGTDEIHVETIEINEE